MPPALDHKAPAASFQTLLPAGARIIETASLTKIVHKPRVLVLWMLGTAKHAGGQEYCGTSVEGNYYWDGPASLSLIDTAEPRIVNTVAILGRGGNGFRLPALVSNSYYFV